MSEEVTNLIAHSIGQWQTVLELMEVGNMVSGRANDAVAAQVEDNANQCLEVTRRMTPAPPDRALARKLQRTLVEVAREASDEGAKERILSPQV